MQTLAILFAALAQMGVSVNDVQITTVKAHQQASVYDCHAFVDDATVLVCPDSMQIIIVQD